MRERIRRGAWILKEKEPRKSKIKSEVLPKITKKTSKPKEQSSFFCAGYWSKALFLS